MGHYWSGLYIFVQYTQVNGPLRVGARQLRPPLPCAQDRGARQVDSPPRAPQELKQSRSTETETCTAAACTPVRALTEPLLSDVHEPLRDLIGAAPQAGGSGSR